MKMEEIRYVQTGEPHRSIAPSELIDLINQGRGLTGQTMTNILNNNVMPRLRRLLANNTVTGKLMNGLTAGRPPLAITKLGQGADIGFTTNMMIMGYTMWLLRQIGLLTSSVNLDAPRQTLTTTAALKSAEILEPQDIVIQLKLMFYRPVLDKSIFVAQNGGSLPVIICKSISQLTDTYEQLSDPAKSLGVIGVISRVQQNVKWLSVYLFTIKGVIRLTGLNLDQLAEVLCTIQLSQHDEQIHTSIMSDYEQSRQLALIHQPFLMKAGN